MEEYTIQDLIDVEMLLEENRFDFPDGLPANVILKMFDINAIIERLTAGVIAFDDFANEFSKAGGSLNALVDKVIEEHGLPVADPDDDYSSVDVQILEFLLALICAGADSIEMSDFIECVECLDMGTKEAFYEALDEAGIPY